MDLMTSMSPQRILYIDQDVSSTTVITVYHITIKKTVNSGMYFILMSIKNIVIC